MTARSLMCYPGNNDCMKLLIEKGADVNEIDTYGRTALFWACEHGELDLVKLLIENGADINHKDKKRETPLMVAADSRHPDVLRVLIKRIDHVNSEHGVILTPSQHNEYLILLDTAEQNKYGTEEYFPDECDYYSCGYSS
eukprot:GHVR01136572.1.p1 GENE.GHVR01136572.1~~GHVR01136572.1.p1  ORF type:complete len:140 (-),score=16.10 GHVR01136572.1:176-595(-)